MNWTKYVAYAILILSASRPLQAQDFEDRRLLAGVVRLESQPIGGEPETGSGIFLGTENGTAYILTALHVLVGPMKLRDNSGWERRISEIPIDVEFYGEPRRYKGKMFERWNEERDLAIVTVEDRRIADLDIAVAYGVGSATTLSPPYPAIAVGHGGRDWNLVATRVTSVLTPKIEIQGRGISPGFSGGALIDTTRHLLTGMLVAVTQERGEAVAADFIIAELDSWRIPHHLRKTKISSPMLRIPAGPFVVGPELSAGTQPAKREIYLDAYFIDKYEVTVGDFQRFVTETGYDYQPGVVTCNFGQKGHEGYPMNCVSWDDAKGFAAWAGKELPSEAQWLKAAAGASGHKYPWGDTPPGNGDAAIRIEWPTPVGSHPRDKSAYGAMDMLGNVSEWLADWYQRDYPDLLEERNPRGPASGEDRVLRGASFETRQDTATLGLRKRDLQASGRKRFDYGFRCVLNEQEQR